MSNLIELTTDVDLMHIRSGTWANINGAAVDKSRYVEGQGYLYDVNGVRIKSCLLEPDGKLQFSKNTPVQEQISFARLCANPKTYVGGPGISVLDRLASAQAATGLEQQLMCQTQSYWGNPKCLPQEDPCKKQMSYDEFVKRGCIKLNILLM